ncbi:MAG TPA: DUF1684 domain-containing protein [Blastocatellia bacterium]|nr:DUF1684 domain-containing protein [Blastocatellia bacterium]
MQRKKISCGPCKILVLALFVTALASASIKPVRTDQPAYSDEIEKWRKARAEEMTSEEGWLSLVGLYWLSPGKNRFGGDPSNEIVFPKDKAPRHAGTLWLDGGAVRLEVNPGVVITSEGQPVTSLALKSDADGKATRLALGSLSFYVIKRGERLGLRVKDRQNAARSHFAGIKTYPLDPKWRIEARFEAYEPTKQIPIVNVLGMTEDQPSPGAVVFEVGGKTYRLDAIQEKGSRQLFIIFADKTNGHATYGAGRYLYTPKPGADGKLIIDFNKSENPPCAFTSYATCPLPPRQNRLPIPVEAGEQKYAGSAH